MYFRFMTCLAVGLFGLSLLMMTVYDVLFQDWDVVEDIRRAAARWARRQRTRYVLMDEDKMRAVRFAPRSPQPERTSLGVQYRSAVPAPSSSSASVVFPPKDLASV